ncbi:YppF family protein [Lentibacillus sp. Marseille-P4043]|uniref:YppF family protein n=1 Tax=Lentibacillus sp. Marseille-P4043 TaxID=2040293 RepID=UPI000D0BE818|nr:YppF family protein [Lentibacillus sp. Marseille-P4043]
MQLNELIKTYEQDRKQAYGSINQLLDFYQKKYIAGEIDITSYQEIFHILHDKGAKSSHEYAL